MAPRLNLTIDPISQRTSQFSVSPKHHHRPPSTTPTPNNRIRKRVSFSEWHEQYEIIHVDDYTDEEYRAAFMDDSDYDRIDKDTANTIKILKRSNQGQYKEEFRGLEVQLPHAKVQRKARYRSLVKTVLQEQETSGELHPDWVMKRLCPYTGPFAQAAWWMGVFDYNSVLTDLAAEMMQQQQNYYCYYGCDIPSKGNHCTTDDH